MAFRRRYCAANIKVVSDSNEIHAILKAGELESALGRPRMLHLYEECRDIITLGVRLMEGLAKNHCFMQGNKRTAFHASIVFMEQNEIFLDVADTEANAQLVLDLESGAITEAIVIEALRRRMM